MPRKAYSIAQKREAVAQGRVMGIAAAAQSLGIDPRSIAKWSTQAGDGPELDGNAAAWQRAFDLAHAKVEGILASGKASAVTAATIMGIAQRNMRDIERDRRLPESESSVAARELFMDWLCDSVPDESIATTEAYEATAAAIDAVRTMLLLPRANGETPNGVENSDHRRALLAWLSGREEIPAGDILEWSKAQVLDVLTEHGSLATWHAAALAEEAADEAERHRMADEIRAKAQAAQAASAAATREATLDPETRELLAAAEAYLRESADA